MFGQVDSFPNGMTMPPSDLEMPPSEVVSTSAESSDVDVKISDSALDEKLEIGAKDSMSFDNASNKMYLYGDAFVKYEGLELKAGFIAIDLDSKIASAEMFKDSIGREAGKPSFIGNGQNFQADKMRYNFNSQKGLVYGVSTTQSNLFLTGTKTKFISREIVREDTATTENVLYNSRAIFSTCDLPHPHFGIRSSKQKVIADRVVVAGPSNLEIGGIPLPIVLPFAVFPLKQFKSTGLIFPQGYEYSPQLGYGLDGVGWYFPLNDYMDLRMTGQIYWHGTWGITADSRYRRRYKYNGNLNLTFNSRRSIGATSRQNSYAIRWSHTQDSKAHPTRRFSGSVNIQGNGYQSLINNDARSVLQNTLSSNVSFSQTFPGKPFRLSADMRHSQNTQTNKVDISLPTVSFQMNRVYPFKSKERSSGSKEKWYEKISFRYDAQAQNKFTATDTTLFTQKTLEDARFGFRHNMSTDLNFNLLKYINVSPNATLREVYNFHTIRRNFDPTFFEEVIIDTLENIVDTTQYGAVITDTLFGLEPFRELTTGVSFNTILYGMLQFKKGPLKGIRHTVKPTVSLNYIPSYIGRDGFFRSGVDSVQTDTRDPSDLDAYNIFQGGIYGTPRASKRQMLLNYSLNNIFEAKFFSKKDSVDKKIKLFDNIRVGGSYNFAADSLKFSTISANATTRLFKGITTVGINASWDPYAVNANNRRINKFYWREAGKPLRFLQASFRFNSRMSVSSLKKLFKKESPKSSGQSTTQPSRGSRSGGTTQPQPQDGFLKFLEGFNLNHSFVFNAAKDNNQQTQWEVRTHSLNVTIQQIQLTPNWGVGVGNIGYDFKNSRTTYPDLRITRNLHCWEAFFAWQPQRGTYYFTIRVKNAPLDALEIPYSKNNVDAFGGF
ncbi:MAG: putative LPS assembly protein LptD [Bacteroidota bacterium]